MNKTPWQLSDGHKTQVAAIMNLVLMFAAGRDWIQPDAINMIAGVMFILTGVAVGHGVKKQIKK